MALDNSSKKNKTLCFSHQSYVAINDKFINSIFSGKSFTLECWAKPNRDKVNTKSNMMLFGQKADHEGGKNYAMHFGIFSIDHVGMRYNYNDMNIRVGTNELEGYHHYAFVYDHQSMRRKIFFDGTLIGSDVASSHLLSAERFMIGRTPWNVNDDWGGNIRDVRIWNTSRSDAQIANYSTVLCRSSQGLMDLFTEYVSLIYNCDIFSKTFHDIAFPKGIIELIVQYDMCGLVACYPFIANVENGDARVVFDLVSGIKGELNGSVCWQ
eukprot:119810_1